MNARRQRLDSSKRLDIDQALRLLKAGGIVAYPTETFLGLGVNAMVPEAVDSLRALKGRGGKPISVVIANRDMLPMVALPLSDEGERLVDTFWPGPLTLVVRARDTVPLNLRAGGPTIGVRVSSHIVAQTLAAGIGGPVTSTSCNRADRPEPTRPEQVEPEVIDAIAGYVEGVAPGGKSSTIVDLSADRPTVIRTGAVSIERLREVAPTIEVVD